MSVATPWDGWYNAEVYRAFLRRHPVYDHLNRRLVELAEITSARRVLDLACGSGATARACLRRLPGDGELVGVDASEAMIELARMEVRDPRARFQVAAAAAVAEAVPGPFDRAVSNAAFWQFPAPRPVLASLARILAPGALLVFNIPAERVAGEAAQVHPFQVALARAIERRTHRPFPRRATGLDPAHLAQWLDETGFEVVDRVRFPSRGRQGELMELMEIPAMLAPLSPGLSPEARRQAISEARARTDPDEAVAVPWIYFIARRGPSLTGGSAGCRPAPRSAP